MGCNIRESPSEEVRLDKRVSGRPELGTTEASVNNLNTTVNILNSTSSTEGNNKARNF